MTKISMLVGIAILGAAACNQSVTGPVGAPAPTHPDMTFVDGNGCSWWVIGNATSYSWAPHTNSRGEQVCGDGTAPVVAPAAIAPDVPFITEEDVATAPPRPAVAAVPAAKPKPAAPAPAPVPQATAGGTRFVQVATFAKAENATAAHSRFQALGLPVRASSTQAGSDGFYRLVLGPFGSDADVTAALNAARGAGFTDAFTFKR